VHTHRSIDAAAVAVNEALAVDAGRDAWLCCLPLGHVAGLAVLVRAFEAGCPVEVAEGFDADLVRDAPGRQGVTLTSLVPTALARTDVTGYRAVLVGGAAPHGTLPPNVRVSYGMTETFGAVTVDGRPVPGAELAVRDGEVLVRSTALGRTYRGAGPVADADGWFHTGDAGELDAAGRLVVHGRRGEMIITGGENVWPAPVEAILAGVSGVAEVAVVGRADPTWGQAVTAVVVPADPRHPPALDELRDAVKEQLAAFAAPRRLELVARLPRTALGKLRRSALVDPT
jgi:O-succinylbenzoic acid--CoA ligase